MVERNWAGNVIYGVDAIAQPASLDEVQGLVAAAAARGESIRVVGSRHSFTDITDAQNLISLAGLDENIAYDADTSTVSVAAHITYGRLIELLAPIGMAVANLASLPHISIGGAIATGTHGSGDQNPGLASAVVGVEFVDGAGELRAGRLGEPGFAGMPVHLGALGVLHRVTLRVEPAFEVAQTVYPGVAWEDFGAEFDAIFASGYSVSAFTDWRGRIDQVWVKRRTDQPVRLAAALAAAGAATEALHPVPGMPPENCTAQGGVAGSWGDRLPHFRLAFAPSAGDEIQSEFFVDRRHHGGVIEAMRGIGPALADALIAAELRTVAADGLWMSPCVGRDSLALHFTWRPNPASALAAATLVGETLRPFGVRPHWGKVFAESCVDPAEHPHRPEFAELVRAHDPAGVFVNLWFDRLRRMLRS